MITFTQQLVEKKIEEFCERQFSKEAQKLEDANDILDYCIKKAWMDATQRERFKGQKSEIIQNKESITSNLKIEIENLEPSSNYDAWHEKMCSNPEHKMTYGIWQKLINMTFKYMYCRRKKFPNIDFSKCHCPIDHIIAQRADNLCIVCGLERSKIMRSIAERGETNWNNMGIDEYQEVRNKILEITQKCTISNSETEHPTALEFDFLLW